MKKGPFYTKGDLQRVAEGDIPEHVAVIMDGNRRWETRENSSFSGHLAGANRLIEIVEAAQEIGVKILTVYAFSTENWARPKSEVELLFKIFKTYLQEHEKQMIEQGVRFDVIGDLSMLSSELQEKIACVKERTNHGKMIDFVVALNYGGRDEIRRGVKRVVRDCLEKKISIDGITEELISGYLDTARWKDPDLLIRTSGETRISNFLLWQLAYCEIYMTEVLWPDFNSQDLLKAIEIFQKRERRRGA